MNELIYNFLAAVQTAVSTATNSATVLPGGLWYGRAPDDTGFPYGVVEVTNGKKTYTTNGFFLQNVTLKITVFYTDGGVAAASIKNIGLLLSGALDFKYLTMTSGKVISIHPAENIPSIDSALRAAKDVFLGSFSWEVIISGGNTL